MKQNHMFWNNQKEENILLENYFALSYWFWWIHLYSFYESHGLWKWFEFNGFYWNHDLDFSQFSIEWIKFVFYLKGYLSKFSWSFSIHDIDNYILKLYVNQDSSSWFSRFIKEEMFYVNHKILYAWIEILFAIN